MHGFHIPYRRKATCDSRKGVMLSSFDIGPDVAPKVTDRGRFPTSHLQVETGSLNFADSACLVVPETLCFIVQLLATTYTEASKHDKDYGLRAMFKALGLCCPPSDTQPTVTLESMIPASHMIKLVEPKAAKAEGAAATAAAGSCGAPCEWLESVQQFEIMVDPRVMQTESQLGQGTVESVVITHGESDGAVMRGYLDIKQLFLADLAQNLAQVCFASK